MVLGRNIHTIHSSAETDLDSFSENAGRLATEMFTCILTEADSRFSVISSEQILRY